MKTTLVLLLIFLTLWSFFTTFKAIYLILTKDFKGNKARWIIIVMIGIIGPILWITKGKKMISKGNG